jgi:hypothetical protein
VEGTTGYQNSPEIKTILQDRFSNDHQSGDEIGIVAVPVGASVDELTQFAANDHGSYIGGQLYIVYTSVVLEQEGFRWRDDDGSESGASWLEDQDVDTTIAKSTNVRLRVLLNATGDPPSTQYQLEYKETSDGASEWRKVPEA